MELRGVVYTIGYRQYSADTFLRVLDRVGVTKLVDVRSTPFSKRAEYNRDSLKKLLGPRYLWKGRELGGLKWPQKPEGYEQGIQWLVDNAASEVLCVMCQEPDPNQCHRGFWISVDLQNRGVKVVHLGFNGKAPKRVDHQLDEWR